MSLIKLLEAGEGVRSQLAKGFAFGLGVENVLNGFENVGSRGDSESFKGISYLIGNTPALNLRILVAYTFCVKGFEMCGLAFKLRKGGNVALLVRKYGELREIVLNAL